MSRVMDILLCRWLRPHHYILLMIFCLLTAFITAYGISVSSDHVNALFPYISEAGTTVPESCIFGIFLNLGAVLAFICMYIRHENFANFATNHKLLLLNDISLLIGFFSTLGLCIVANFQEKSILTVHLVGATMTFAGGVVYCWIQAYLTYHSRSNGLNSDATLHARILIAFFVSLFFTMVFVGSSVANLKWKDASLTGKAKIHWNDSEPGYGWHLISTFSEWLMAFSFIIFFITFYQEFRNIRVKVDLLTLYNFDSPGDRAGSPGAQYLA